MSVGSRLWTFGLASMSLPLVACAGEPSGPESATNLDVRVAPLSLPGLSNVCYGIVVENETPEEVWSRTNVCSDRFGNGPGGDISYVGPCDFDEPLHTVTLTIESVTDENNLVLGDGDWVNPCPPGEGCPLQVLCEENADTPVTFNITVMRAARQGFFDIAVEFEDVFCSGKIDCVDTSGEPIELLFNEDGDRDQTAVVALACTGGPGEGEVSQIHMSDVQIVCGENEPVPVGFAETLFGDCFDVGGGQQVLGYGLNTAIFLPAPVSAEPNTEAGQPQILHNQLYPQHVLYSPTGTPAWNVDIIPDAQPPVPFDTAIVYARLGAGLAVMAYIDHAPDYASGPNPDLPGIEGIGIGVGTWNGTGWTASTSVLELPTEVASAIFHMPDFFNGEYLVTSALGFDVEARVLYRWDGTAFEPGIVLEPPVVTEPDHYFRWSDIHDGVALGEVRDSTNNDAAVSVWVASAETGWTAVQLVVPAYVVPANHIYAGYALVDALDVGNTAPRLLPGGLVAYPTIGTKIQGPDTLTAAVTGLFTPDGSGAWTFAVHPVYAYDYSGDTGEPGDDQWPLSQQTLQVGGVGTYRDFSTVQLADGPPVDMFRIYKHATSQVWDHYPTIAAADTNEDGQPDANIVQMTLIGLVERGNLPALALYSLDAGEGSQRLELGMLGNATNVGGAVVPLLTLADANGPLLLNGGWRIQGVERDGDGRFLLLVGPGQAQQNNETPTATVGSVFAWDVTVVDGASPTATGAVVGIQTSLSRPYHLGGGFRDAQGTGHEPGDITFAAIPGGCDGVGGLAGSAGPSAIRTQSRQTSYAAFDFTDGSDPISAVTLGYGDDVNTSIAAVEASFASTSGPFQISLPPSATEGNQWDVNTVPDGQPVWQHAVYAGEEALNCNGEPCNKVYYNTAIGFDPTEPNCTLYFAATASGGTTISNGAVPAGHVYPVLVGAVPLTGADPATEGLLCDQHPLGSPEFSITYTPATSQGVQFCHSWNGTALTTNVADPMMCNYFSITTAMQRATRSDSKTATPIFRGEERQAAVPVE